MKYKINIYIFLSLHCMQFLIACLKITIKLYKKKEEKVMKFTKQRLLTKKTCLLLKISIVHKWVFWNAVQCPDYWLFSWWMKQSPIGVLKGRHFSEFPFKIKPTVKFAIYLVLYDLRYQDFSIG